jgi:hypothetical protein
MGTINKDFSLPPYNASNWNSPLNENFTILDSCLGDTQNISLVGSDYNLLLTDVQNMRINFVGNIGGGDVNVIFPANIGGSWIVSNNAVSTGGSIFLRTANFTVPPIKIAATGSEYVFSDGKNVYSAVAGTEGAFLPTTGGEITGNLKVDKDLNIVGNSAFVGTTTFTGNASFQNVIINGTVNLLATTIGVGKFTVGNFQLSGDLVFGVTGPSAFNGNISLSSGNISLALGSITVANNGAASSLAGTTTIPQAASLIVKSGANFTIETGANVSLGGTFSPQDIVTKTVTASTGITVTGTGGVKAGPGGIQSDGASTFNQPVTFNGTASFYDTVVFNKAITTSFGSILNDPKVTPSNNISSIHFLQPSGFNAGMVTNQKNQMGFFKENTLTVGAYLDLATGKFKAIGGLAISLNSIGASDIAAHLPSTVISRDSGACGDDGTIDINLVLAALVNKVVELESQLSALKGGNRS